ncbi:hypothetical protein [Kitasatospora sp. NBC_01266]|uniref:hypothetical protein n=1 Tax=Kitasatospora sp. NBC_01266 TaxID=2903572 RepID=UPI002E332C39|nr:hypothetical protein [Kitasatospora sp. NBC_01266]
MVSRDADPLVMYGNEWQIDSSAFNKWLVTYFREYTPVRVWHWMAGEAEYGAVLKTTQKSIADGLGMYQQHVGKAINDLAALDLLWMQRRGFYWLNPFVTIKGGRSAGIPEQCGRAGRTASTARTPGAGTSGASEEEGQEGVGRMSTASRMLWTPTNAFGVISRIGLSGLDRDVLDVLMGLQEPGGRVIATHADISTGLVSRGKKPRDRTSVTRSMGRLNTARLVRRSESRRGGVYLLNEMIAGYADPDDMYEVVANMPEDMRLDDPEFLAMLEQARERAETRQRHLYAV